MNSRFLKVCSILIVLSMLVNLCPVTVFGSGVSLPSEDTSLLQPGESSEPVTEEAEAVPATILGELTDKRTAYTKEYLLSNGLNVAYVYSEAVHYEQNGSWADIDNTLLLGADANYTNKAGAWMVSLPRQLGNENRVTIQKDGYTVRFGLPGEMKLPSDHMSNTGYVISQMNTATAELESVDTAALRESMEYPETLLENISSKLKYRNVYSNTDVSYELISNRLKESIILGSYDASVIGYCYVLDTGELTPQLREDGSILLVAPDGETVVMSMPAPFLVDSAGNTCTDVPVSLLRKGSSWLLGYQLPAQWLSASDRSWPVILDPVVEAEIENRGQLVSISQNSSSVDNMNVRCGYHPTAQTQRSYLKFNQLPILTSADAVVSANLSLKCSYATGNATSVSVHRVTENWNAVGMTWQTQPSYEGIPTDLNSISLTGRYYWDITAIVQKWYKQGNFGLAITNDIIRENGSLTDTSYVVFSNPFSQSFNALTITYRSANQGLEDYWDYTASSAGRAGTGYVQNYSGNLVWVRPDMGFGGNRMPVTINHIYNSADAQNNDFGMGYGWRSNYNQRILRTGLDENNDSIEDCLIWEDEDGTSHYFYFKSGDDYHDEDNLGLILEDKPTEFVITDKQGNTSHFDTYGRLVKIENNQSSPSSITVEYMEETTPVDYRIKRVRDGVGRLYRFYYTTNSKVLEQLMFFGFTEGQYAYAVNNYFYTDSKLIRIVDYDYTYNTFEYDSANNLISAKDPNGRKMVYTYTSGPQKCVETIQETQVKADGSIATGSRMEFEFGFHQMMLNHDGKISYLRFNDWGNTVSAQDPNGTTVFTRYVCNTYEDTGIKHRVVEESLPLNSDASLVLFESFENEHGWQEVNDTSTLALNAAQHYHEAHSLQVTSMPGNAGNGIQYANITVPAETTYTFSAYLQVNGGSAFLRLSDGTNVISSASISNTNKWRYAEVSYTNPTEEAVDLTAYILSESTGSFFVDNVQLKDASAESGNCIQNSDFLSTDLTDCNGWQFSGTDDGIQIMENTAPNLNHYVAALHGVSNGSKSMEYLIQGIGSANKPFVFGVWLKGENLKATNTNAQITATVHFIVNGNNGDQKAFTLQKDALAMDGWQYFAGAVMSPADFTGVSVELEIENYAGTLYADGFQLYYRGFGTKYEYLTDGNLMRTTDVLGQSTTYYYGTTEGSGSNDLTEIVYPQGGSVIMDYDSYHNIIKEVSRTGVITSYTYDAYGNMLSTTVKDTETSPGITASWVYETSHHNYPTQTTDSTGETTQFGYNRHTNMLEWVQKPGETAATCTTYTYDNMFRLTSTQDVNGELDLYANYTYTNNQLTQLSTPSTAYSFTYGDFGLRSSVSIGGRTLATYTYSGPDHALSRLGYGNGDYVEYTYDRLGRVTKETYEDGSTVTYQYTPNGSLDEVQDSATGRNTKYQYDSYGRVIKVTTVDSEHDRTIEYVYDDTGRIEVIREYVDDILHRTAFGYRTADDALEWRYFDQASSRIIRDDYDRVTERYVWENATEEMIRYVFMYRGGNTNPTGQVSEQHTYFGNSEQNYIYTYDSRGNIKSIGYGAGAVCYDYDAADQLIREDNPIAGKTWTWEYDDAGNILSKKEYAYTTGELGEPLDTITYGYTDDDWGDLLTSYDGRTITYDAIGNPTSDGIRTYTWEHGRQLASMTYNSTTWDYYYGTDGLRTKRTCGSTTYEYIYTEGKLTGMFVQIGTQNYRFAFGYDALGNPMSMDFEGQMYYYLFNLQGDVVAILDNTGKKIVEYSYDAWGSLLSFRTYDTSVITRFLGRQNPLRYRGYVYDSETDLYYLQSRYYNPEIGRFLNADAYASTGQGLGGNNTFAYCNNNPVIYQDYSGCALETVFDIISLGASIAQVAVNPADPWAWIGLIGDIADVAIPCVAGLGEAIRALKAVDAIDDTIDIAKITANTLEVISDTAQALSLGENIVYTAYDARGLEYVGITSAFERREKEWKKTRQIHQYIENVDRNTAHYAEQTIITLFGRGGTDGLSNIRNSIGKNGKRYAGYLEFFGKFFA